MPRVAPLALAAIGWFPQAVRAESGPVIVAPLQGNVSQAQFLFVRRVVKEAERANAAALIFDMNTYGGALAAAIQMQETLFRTSVPTFTYINPNAGSAGALIAVSTRHIYMAPVSAIGAAAPVMGGGQDLPETMTDKTVSYFSGYFRSAAERNGHRPDIAEAFINKEKEVKIGEEVIHPKGSVLTLSAQEAVREVEGKPLLAEGVAGSVEELVSKAGLGGTVRRIEPMGFERIAFWITALAPILLLGGIIGGYIEIKTPGFGVPGAVSIICFALFFFGHYVAGLAGMELVGVFALGMLLVFVEVFLFPGTVLVGVIGVGLMGGALFLAMVDRYPKDPVLPSFDALTPAVINLSITAGATVLALLILARLLPKTPLYTALVLQGAQVTGASLPGRSPNVGLRVGEIGVARSALRPSGRAEFGGVLSDVVTEGDFVEAGGEVRVISVDGMRVVVGAVRA
jgi:membrane-bound serine protease (ClpP class)